MRFNTSCVRATPFFACRGARERGRPARSTPTAQESLPINSGMWLAPQHADDGSHRLRSTKARCGGLEAAPAAVGSG